MFPKSQYSMCVVLHCREKRLIPKAMMMMNMLVTGNSSGEKNTQVNHKIKF